MVPHGAIWCHNGAKMVPELAVGAVRCRIDMKGANTYGRYSLLDTGLQDTSGRPTLHNSLNSWTTLEIFNLILKVVLLNYGVNL